MRLASLRSHSCRDNPEEQEHLSFQKTLSLDIRKSTSEYLLTFHKSIVLRIDSLVADRSNTGQQKMKFLLTLFFTKPGHGFTVLKAGNSDNTTSGADVLPEAIINIGD